MTDKQIEKITGRPVIKNNDPKFLIKKKETDKNGKPIIYKKTGGAVKKKK